MRPANVQTRSRTQSLQKIVYKPLPYKAMDNNPTQVYDIEVFEPGVYSGA